MYTYTLLINDVLISTVLHSYYLNIINNAVCVPVLSHLKYTLSAHGDILFNRMVGLLKQKQIIITNNDRILKYFVS